MWAHCLCSHYSLRRPSQWTWRAAQLIKSRYLPWCEQNCPLETIDCRRSLGSWLIHKFLNLRCYLWTTSHCNAVFISNSWKTDILFSAVLLSLKNEKLKFLNLKPKYWTDIWLNAFSSRLWSVFRFPGTERCLGWDGQWASFCPLHSKQEDASVLVCSRSHLTRVMLLLPWNGQWMSFSWSLCYFWVVLGSSRGAVFILYSRMCYLLIAASSNLTCSFLVKWGFLFASVNKAFLQSWWAQPKLVCGVSEGGEVWW